MTQDHVKSKHPELTELQLKCLEGFWNRRSAKQIASNLGISEAWVNKNLMGARRALHVNSSADAAAIVFGGQRGSIKSYYYQETDLPQIHQPLKEGGADRGQLAPASAASERVLINHFGAGQTLGLIFAVAISAIAGLLLLVQSALGIAQIWKALGY